VPELQANASLLVGGEMFEATSALYLGGEYLHMGARTDYDGQSLPAFDVINLVLQARLIDAHLYLRYLNVLNEAYATYDGYLMTPRTFAYGIEWTLFN
jgi:outer membrane receptor protein involved in Fe transport